MRATLLAILLASAATSARPATAQPQPAPKPEIEVRFCPTQQLRSYPLDASGRHQGLVLQGFSVTNRGDEPLKIDEIDVALLKDGKVVDTRLLDSADIDRWVGNGPPLREAARAAPFEFCSRDILPADVKLAGPQLKRNEGILVIDQVFAFERFRDGLGVTVHGSAGPRKVTASATIPIKTGFAVTQLTFPLKGVWYVGWGPSFHSGHRAHPPEEFALDIGKLGANASTYRGKGLKFSDYYAYGAPVLAAGDGKVVKVRDGRPEDPASLQRPGETSDAYAQRHAAALSAGIAGAQGQDWAAGNYVIIDHGEGEYSLYAHLQPGSLKVKPGDVLAAGTVLGKLGSSGNSTEPHLHFQVCDQPDPLFCAGIPAEFSNVTILWADGPRALQSGDIVTAR